jgi:glycosyltransferase involved in cell wall biosynthesis
MLPTYLNELKLIVLPSFSEGLPNIMIEAMACGTLVLATPVGSIPDYIVDKQTGFIMETNSPECIAKNILRALNFCDIDRVVSNAKSLVEYKFKPEVSVQEYREAFQFQ